MTFRRAIILPGVLIVVSIAAMIGVAALSRTDAHQDLATASIGSMQSRSLAWSGVLAAQSQLFANRQGILSGDEPTLTPMWSTQISGGTGVIRLLPLSGTEDENPMYYAYESARVDANSISEESLAKLEGIGPELASKIVAMRGAGFQCAESIAAVEGITDELLFGPMRDAEGPVDRRGILESLTTFAFDPNISAGVGEAQTAGEPRIPLSTPWSDQFARVVTQRCGEGAAQALAQIAGGKVSIQNESDVLRALKSKGVPISAWGSVLDVICVTDDLFRIGKTDINKADPSVLSLIPGFDDDIAGKIVAARSGLAASKKSDLTWILSEGVVDEERYLQAVDHIAVRSAQFRIRVEAGVRVEDGRDEDPASEEVSAERLDRAVILEAVIDIAGDVPRIAYLRDVTHLQSARRLAREVELREKERDETDAVRVEVDTPDESPANELGTDEMNNADSVTDESLPDVKDTLEDAGVGRRDGEESGPPKLMDRRIGRWKIPSRS